MQQQITRLSSLGPDVSSAECNTFLFNAYYKDNAALVLNHAHIEDHELAMNNSTNTSIAIGAESVGDGEITIGNNQNHDSLKIDVSTQHKVNVAGSTKLSVHDTYTKLKTDLHVSGMLTDLDGYALLPNSYRVSGSHASEVRMLVLDPTMLLVDSNQA